MHRTETKPVDGRVAADFENAALRGRLLNSFCYLIHISNQS